MSPQFHNNVYNHHFLVFFICVWLIYSTVHAASSELNSSGIQCVESERAALLQFKHDIRVDNCGLLDSWGDDLDCCRWNGIHCNNRSGHVIGLHLPGTEEDPIFNSFKACLEGTLSESLVELKHLKYLDLSVNHFQGQIPKFIGSLSSLEHLNLSNAGFMGVVPQEIGNLSRLSSLDLSHVGWKATNTWLQIVNSLPLLQVLHLDECGLSLELSSSDSSLSYINSSSTLNYISLLGNNLNDTSIFGWLSRLKGLDTSLQYLDLSENPMFGNNVQLTGHAVKLLGSLCNLQTLDLSGTNLYYDFSDIIESFSKCPNKALVSLDLSNNQIWGSISQGLCGLSMLESLRLDINSLKAVVTGEHLSNLSKLKVLYLGSNKEVVVNISANWIPPFQLDELDLSNCKVGPDFPMWLTTQKHLTSIILSNTSISDTVPVSFFNSLSSKLQYLEMSGNMMHGVIPDVSIIFDTPPYIDLSSNKFSGAIPRFLRNVSRLNLHNNSFSQGLVPLLCPQNKMPLESVDLSNNLFSAKLPDCWGYFDKLILLNLQNNKLWGSLPKSIGMLDKLNVLHMSNNNISGELPSSLVNCKSLILLDLSYNSLTGYIPPTFWNSIKNLSIVTLQNNNFDGTLTSSICQLSQIQILDLSNNLISGFIPKCIYNLRGMANTNNVLETIFDYTIGDPYDGEVIMWKRKKSFFQGFNTLGLAKTIDFSNNKLEGDIPEGISSLIGLVTLNLSRNHLSGTIPTKIGQLTSLETLDLSHNHLFGEIPSSLDEINPLGVLDLSYNNLSGKIPTGPHLQTFDNSTFIGNPGLCGPPLPKCPGDEAATIPQNGDNASPHHEHHLDDFMLGLYISVVLGFILGFWGVCGTLVLKRSWRHAFFRFYNDTKDRIYVIIVFHIPRVWRRS